MDPNNCDVCQCPDGYGGALCDQVAASDVSCPIGTTETDGVIAVTSEEQCITLSAYSAYTQCNWKLQVNVCLASSNMKALVLGPRTLNQTGCRILFEQCYAQSYKTKISWSAQYFFQSFYIIKPNS